MGATGMVLSCHDVFFGRTAPTEGNETVCTCIRSRQKQRGAASTSFKTHNPPPPTHSTTHFVVVFFSLSWWHHTGGMMPCNGLFFVCPSPLSPAPWPASGKVSTYMHHVLSSCPSAHAPHPHAHPPPKHSNTHIHPRHSASPCPRRQPASFFSPQHK